MLMGRNARKHSDQELLQHPKPSAEVIAKTLADVEKRYNRTAEQLPKLSELVTALDPERRRSLLNRIMSCQQALELEISNLKSFQERVPVKSRSAFKSVFSALSESRGRTEDLLKRAEDLFHCGASFPVQVSLMTKAHTTEMLDAFHARREAYWKAMYRVPAIQRHVLEELSAVTVKKRFPSTVVHIGTSKKVSEAKLRTAVRGVVSAVEARLGKPGSRVASTERAEIAELLLTTPIAPEKLNQQFLVLKKSAERLADLEIKLKCNHRSVRSKAAQLDPAFAEWKELAREFGGGALTARTLVTQLERLQTPYMRLRQYITSANFPFVKKLVNDSQKLRPFKDDLFQDGAIGFMRAIERFDRASGFALLTYAGFWVRQMAARGFERDAQIVTVPSRMSIPLAKLRNEPESAVREGLKGVGKRLGLRPDEVEALLPLRNQVRSLSHRRAGSNRSLETLVPSGGASPEASVVEAHDRAKIAARLQTVLAQLPERDRLIINSRFGLDGQPPRTLNEVGAALGLTKERVRQLEANAMIRLRYGPTGKELEKIESELRQ